MPRFKYVARDAQGKAINGAINAVDEVELRRALRANELHLVKHNGMGASAVDTAPSMFDKKIKPNDMVVFSRQLATLFRAGLPVNEILHTVKAQTDIPVMRNALTVMIADVTAGTNLSEAMKKHPKIFSVLFCSLVSAGEQAGTLDKTLEIAADNINKETILRDQVKGAMVYPKLVVAACFLTVIAMMILVVPTFAKVYKSLRVELPAITQLLVKMSAFILSYWWMIVLAGFVFVKLFKWWASTPEGKRIVDKQVLKLPIVGIIVRKSSIARFAQTLAGASKGGVPVLQALTLSSSTAGNSVIADAVMEAMIRVREGMALGPELERTGQFPPLVTRMITSGEQSGSLDMMLDEINGFYERDVKNEVDKLTKIMEPLMTVAVGGIVLFILLALYMPIFSLGSAFRGEK